MKRTAFIAGLFLCAGIFSAQSQKVGAQAPSLVLDESSNAVADNLAVLHLVDQQSIKHEEAVRPPAPVEHTVVDGETMDSIAELHQTTWQRLYAKNLQIVHPDMIRPGEKLIVPTADEELAERALPEPPAPVKKVRSSARTATPRMYRGSSAGNTYTYGYCTWYAKNKRPDLPNNLGNADTWVSRAAAQGIPTGSTPRVGAIGQRGMHVVYVERVNSDGTVFISEMNREGWNVVSTRTVSASYFTYIY